MSWSYRKSIKIIPGIKLNISKSGLSTTIGTRGANVNIGGKGTYLNTGIPGTGLSFRQKIGGSNTLQNTEVEEQVYLNDNIFSADVLELSSSNLEAIKESIVAAQNQKEELKKDKDKVKLSLYLSKIKWWASQILLYGLFMKDYASKIKHTIDVKKDTVKQIDNQITNSYLELNLDLEESVKETYTEVVNNFKELCKSNKIWDQTSSHSNARSDRSGASHTINRKEVQFKLATLSTIKCELDSLCLGNANGPDMLIYPGFLVMYKSNKEIAIIDFKDLNLIYKETRFIEEEKVPRDSKILFHTWAKVNKSGSKDNRYKDNYQIPVVQYGELFFNTDKGVNESFMVSNYGSVRQFGQSLENYINNFK